MSNSKLNDLLTTRLKREAIDIVKEKNKHLSEYGTIYVGVHETKLSDLLKHDVIIKIGYGSGPSNDVDAEGGFDTYFYFEKIGFNYEEIKKEALQKLQNSELKK